MLIRTYTHSKKATIISIFGSIIALALFAVAVVSVFNFFYKEQFYFMVVAIFCVALGVMLYKGTNHLTEKIALRELEQKLDTPAEKKR